MDRRTFLGVAVTGFFAGCGSVDRDESVPVVASPPPSAIATDTQTPTTSSPTPTASPTPTPTPTTILHPQLEYGDAFSAGFLRITVHGVAAMTDVTPAPDEQRVEVAVTVRNLAPTEQDPPQRTAFKLVANGTKYPPTADVTPTTGPLAAQSSREVTISYTLPDDIDDHNMAVIFSATIDEDDVTVFWQPP